MRARGFLLLALLLCPVVSGDEVVLKSGGRLSGEVLEVTDRKVVLRMPHGRMEIPRARVKEVIRENRQDYLLREASSRLRLERPEDAVAMFRKAFAQDPKDAAALRGLKNALVAAATARIRNHEHAAARGHLAELRRLDPKDPRVPDLRAALDRDAQTTQDLRKEAQRHLAEGRVSEGFAALERWRLRRPAGDPEVLRVLAHTHLRAAVAYAAHRGYRQALDHLRAAEAHGLAEFREPIADGLGALAPMAVLEDLEGGRLRDGEQRIDGMRSYPDAAVPIFLRGILAHLRGETEKATRHFAEAARVAGRGGFDPSKYKGSFVPLSFAEVQRQALGTLKGKVQRPQKEAARKWREFFLKELVRDTSFAVCDVYAPTRDLARRAGRAATRAFEQASRELLGRSARTTRFELVVHPDRRTYIAADPRPPAGLLSKMTMSREDSAGVTYLARDEAGRRVVRVEVFYGDPGLLENSIPHEAAHVVQHAGLKVFREGHWLDEGLATVFESAAGQERRTVRLRQEPRVFALRELVSLRSTPPGRVSLFYDQAHSFVSFLRKLGGDRAWQSFLQGYRAGKLETLARQLWGIESLDELERRWLESAGLKR